MEIIMLKDYTYRKKYYQAGKEYSVHSIIGTMFCNMCIAEEKSEFESNISEFI